MKEIKSRFNIEERTKIENEFVVYTENLFVSFPDKKKKKKGGSFALKELESKDNKKRKTVLKGVTFSVKKGETLALIGANGAGKTVLMETIIGLNNPDSGELYLNLGEDTYRKNLIKVGMQFQQSKFSKGQRVNNIIKDYTNIYKGRVNKEELENMIDIFSIREFYEQKVDQLSGGQKQRLNLLLALMHNPSLMILDEFITGLDVKTVRKIITYVNELKVKNQASMIIISHQPEEVEELSDRILVLNNGVITKETNVVEVIKEYGSVSLFVEEVI